MGRLKRSINQWINAHTHISKCTLCENVCDARRAMHVSSSSGSKCVFVYWECASNRIDRLDWAHVIYWFALEICIQPYKTCSYDGVYYTSLYANQTANKVYIKYQPLRSVWMQSMLNTPQYRVHRHTHELNTIDRFIANRPIVSTTNIYP